MRCLSDWLKYPLEAYCSLNPALTTLFRLFGREHEPTDKHKAQLDMFYVLVGIAEKCSSLGTTRLKRTGLSHNRQRAHRTLEMQVPVG